MKGSRRADTQRVEVPVARDWTFLAVVGLAACLPSPEARDGSYTFRSVEAVDGTALPACPDALVDALTGDVIVARTQVVDGEQRGELEVAATVVDVRFRDGDGAERDAVFPVDFAEVHDVSGVGWFLLEAEPTAFGGLVVLVEAADAQCVLRAEYARE